MSYGNAAFRSDNMDFKKKLDAAVYLQLKNICWYTMKSERQNENNFLFLYLIIIVWDLIFTRALYRGIWMHIQRVYSMLRD